MYSSFGYDVFCPNLLKRNSPFTYAEEDEAYAHFMETVGFGISSKVEQFLEKLTLKYQYRQVFIIGFSVGATIAWLCARSKVSGIVCYYGSRIRDYLTIKPVCPVLMIIAQQDEAFPANKALEYFCHMSDIRLEVLEGQHSFCDPYRKEYDETSAKKVRELVFNFIENNTNL